MACVQSKLTDEKFIQIYLGAFSKLGSRVVLDLGNILACIANRCTCSTVRIIYPNTCSNDDVYA